MADQFAENAAPARERADLATGLFVDSGVQEALEAALVLIQDSECGIGGAGEIAGRNEHAAQQRLEFELRDDRPTDLEELLEALVREPAVSHGGSGR
jgi:hypothetical protein